MLSAPHQKYTISSNARLKPAETSCPRTLFFCIFGAGVCTFDTQNTQLLAVCFLNKPIQDIQKHLFLALLPQSHAKLPRPTGKTYFLALCTHKMHLTKLSLAISVQWCAQLARHTENTVLLAIRVSNTSIEGIPQHFYWPFWCKGI